MFGIHIGAYDRMTLFSCTKGVAYVPYACGADWNSIKELCHGSHTTRGREYAAAIKLAAVGADCGVIGRNKKGKAGTIANRIAGKTDEPS